MNQNENLTQEKFEHFTAKINAIPDITPRVRESLHNVLADSQKYDSYVYEDEDLVSTGCGWDEVFVNFLNASGLNDTDYATFQTLPENVQEDILDNSEGAKVYFQIFTE